MDHATAVAQDFARRFSAGRLSGAELDAFEEHLLSCRECQRDVAADDRLHVGFKAAGIVPAKAGRVAWQLAPTWAIAASVVLATLGGLAGYWLARPTMIATPQARPAVFLTLDAVRASNDATLTLPRDESAVILRAIIASDMAGQYDIAIRDERGGNVHSISRVAFDPTLDPAVSIAIPSSTLQSGTRYVLVVRRVSDGTTAEYPFAVIQQ